MAALTSRQRKTVRGILQTGRKLKVPRHVELAALMAAKTEANWGSPGEAESDRDSAGPFQIRRMHGLSEGQRKDVTTSAKWFFKNALREKGIKDPARLAQAVERSAFPGRYSPNKQIAEDARRAYYKGRLGGSPSGGGSAVDKGATKSGTKTLTTPGVDRSADRRSLLQSYLQTRHQPDSLLNLATGLKGAADTPSTSVKVKVSGIEKQKQSSSSGGKVTKATAHQLKGVANFEGTKVAAWIKPQLEYARRHGWKGKVTSGYRSNADQARVCATGVKPCAPPGQSNHQGKAYPRGAVDVSDPQGLQRAIRSYPGKTLVFAGAKDPVHFSIPRGGSY